jgi:hypothetical protein
MRALVTEYPDGRFRAVLPGDAQFSGEGATEAEAISMLEARLRSRGLGVKEIAIFADGNEPKVRKH